MTKNNVMYRCERTLFGGLSFVLNKKKVSNGTGQKKCPGQVAPTVAIFKKKMAIFIYKVTIFINKMTIFINKVTIFINKMTIVYDDDFY